MVLKLSSNGNRHSDINSTNNVNPQPSREIYPKRSVHDASFRIHENDLRSAIFIPAHFTYGQGGRVPVLLIPGTGSMGGETFEPNFAKLLGSSTFGDPVWLNVPGRMCDDASRNAEFVAYAINYLSAICNSKIAVVAWSQGTLSVQWSFKYWPSTRTQVNNFIALSGVFRGTVAARLLAPKNGIPCSPAIWQQKRNSNFTATLMSNGGDSAYVPTTSIYSSTDEVVQPQFGKNASARLHDERDVGVTNCEIQVVVGKKPAALMYTHLSMLNPLAWALTEDAITNGGPGRLDRINPKCYLHTKPPGLNMLDVAKTKALSVKCGKAITTFSPKCKTEPELPPYCAGEGKRYMLNTEADLEKASWAFGWDAEAPLLGTPPATWGNEVERELDFIS
ncbi:hypothetical protein BKA64DRAFT_583833 [Cadophora sp. MPI-SDFR-AT-0126]|nr:hypothetical protein BKA64DRAFT_583833 [Leotiomycetes sp. MPI-SDFR-AT-0126]